MMRVITAALAFWLLGVCHAQPPIRVDVNLVNVAFTVRDAQQNLVTGLARDDFEVFEDGVPQTISFFARSAEIPLSLGLSVDFSGSQESFVRQHHRDLQSFLKDVLGPKDQVFLICFGNQLRLVSNFSTSAGEVVNSLRQFERGKRDFPRVGPRERRQLGTGFYDAIYHPVNELLARQPGGRKALLIFSDGEDNSSAFHMLDAIEAAQNADVIVYCIRYTDEDEDGLNARNKYGIRVMDRIAVETGGAHFDARREDLRAHFRRIGEELHSAYELAYHSTNPVRDGTFRKIVIRPKQPGLTVRSKTGYFARPAKD